MIVTAFQICEVLGELHDTGLFQNGAHLFFYLISTFFTSFLCIVIQLWENGIFYLNMEKPLSIYGRIQHFPLWPHKNLSLQSLLNIRDRLTCKSINYALKE